MTNLYLNTGGFNTIFTNLKESFNGELTSKNNEHNLDIKCKLAKGAISGASFDKEISFMHFDLVFYNDATLSIESIQTAPIFFAYCEEGNLSHSFGANGAKKNIKKTQYGILKNTTTINNVLHFESYKRVQFTLIIVPTISNTNENTQFIGQLTKMFTNATGSYSYVGAENVKITKKIQELKAITHNGIVRSVLKKRILKSIVEIEVAQHSYSFIKTFDPILHLAARQLNQIKKISNLNLQEVLYTAGVVSKNFLPRLLREKYHLSMSRTYNQKLVS